MRIDKYLWCIRVYKSRSLATQAINSGKVLLGELVLKASKEVRTGETIEVKRHGYSQHFKVLALPKSRLGAKLVADYSQDVTPQNELDKKELLLLAKSVTRSKGLGRPTKKDRRDLDELTF